MLKKKTKTYDVDGTKIITLLSSRLKELGYKIKEAASTTLIIDTPSSFWSWGEEMSVSANNENQGCNVTVTSDVKYQIIDWGKNEENIDKVFAMIDKIMGDQ